MTLLKRLWNWLADPICGSCQKGTAVKGGVLCPACQNELERQLRQLLNEKGM